MPRTCRACSSPHRKQIDAMLARKEPLRNIAGKFRIAVSSLHRHTVHVAAALEKASQKQGETLGESVLRRLENLYAKTEAVLNEATNTHKHDLLLRAVRETRENLSGIYALAMKSAHSGSLESFSDKAILEEVQRRDLKTETKIVVEYGDKQGQVESAFHQVERPLQLPEVVKQEPEPPTITSEIVSQPRPLPAPRPYGLLSAENHEAFFGANFLKKVL